MVKQLETLLKKPEILRDENGRFDRHGKELSKTSKNKMSSKSTNQEIEVGKHGGWRPGAGRPVGAATNATRALLKDMILGALDRVGGEEYLVKLAIENSSAYAGLLRKVLPTTLEAGSDGGVGVQVVFRREIVLPGGQVVTDQTPKQLPKPDDYSLANEAGDSDEPA